MHKTQKAPQAFKNPDLIIFLCLIIVLTGATVGFANYSQLLQVESVVNVKPQGTLHFIGIELIDSINVDTSERPIFTDDSIDFNLHFKQYDSESAYMAKYQITVQNDTFYDQSFQSLAYEPAIYDSKGNRVSSADLIAEVGGISEGDSMPTGKSVTFIVTINFASEAGGDYDVEGEAGVETEEVEPAGSLTAAISGTKIGNLRGSNIRAPFTLSVINTHKDTQRFDILINNTSHYMITDAFGNALSTLSIEAGATQDYVFYVQRLDGAIFVNETEMTGIAILTTEHERSNVGSITLEVDKTVYVDTTPPTVSNVNLVMTRSVVGEATLSWNSSDDVGAVSHTVELYDKNNQKVATYHTVGDETNMVLSDLEANTYYAKVYGIDAAGNTASTADIQNCTTSAGYCSKSNTAEMKWVFDVSTTFQRISSSGASTANLDSTYRATLRVTALLSSLPSTITVTMGGRTLAAGTGYTYSRDDGSLVIPNVSGDITITASAVTTCLIRGTKILLADGTTKPIENVTYSDKVTVWNYETGKVDYRYPIWIEKTNETNIYQLNRFSDGSELKTYGHHGIFNVDLNRFVTVDNSEEFYVGAHVYKINANNQLEIVEVTEIRNIKEKEQYYHVVSEDFYNIFANNLLTTDGTVILSNLYGFEDGVRWGENRNEIMSNPENLYDYSEFSALMSEKLFDKLRVREGKYLEKIGAMDKKTFIEYLKANQLNPDMYLLPEDF